MYGLHINRPSTNLQMVVSFYRALHGSLFSLIYLLSTCCKVVKTTRPSSWRCRTNTTIKLIGQLLDTMWRTKKCMKKNVSFSPLCETKSLGPESRRDLRLTSQCYPIGKISKCCLTMYILCKFLQYKFQLWNTGEEDTKQQNVCMIKLVDSFLSLCVCDLYISADTFARVGAEATVSCRALI